MKTCGVYTFARGNPRDARSVKSLWNPSRLFPSPLFLLPAPPFFLIHIIRRKRCSMMPMRQDNVVEIFFTFEGVNLCILFPYFSLLFDYLTARFRILLKL